MIKLSEIKGERALDVLADLVEPIANIVSDEKAAELFGMRDLPNGMTVKQYAIKRLTSGIPALLKSHKKDLVKILALLSDKNQKEYAKEMTIDSIIGDVTALMTDPLFNAFFTMQQSTELPSGSVSENTEE